jgi:hypothetical protein
MNNQRYIIRGDRSGVFVAEIESRSGQEAVLKNARRLWQWSGATETLQLALDGVSQPSGCKFTVTVPQLTLTDVIQVCPASEKALASIDAVPVWKA